MSDEHIPYNDVHCAYAASHVVSSDSASIVVKPSNQPDSSVDDANACVTQIIPMWHAM